MTRAMFGAVVYFTTLAALGAALFYLVAPSLPPIPCGSGSCSACGACR
jgi:hypothetical protein